MTGAAGSSGSLAVASLFCDRYRVVREIKAGAMGAVYEVVDERTNARCAMKVLLPSLLHRPDQRARFIKEASVTGGIESEHIVRVFDAGVAGDVPFIVMELLRGTDLQDHLDRHGKLRPAEVCAHITQAARALDKTSAASVVHRDIKPANLFLSHHDDGRPCVKILDFGIAKVVADGGTDHTGIVGTFVFMAPEQINGSGRIDGRVDSYALGHTAYALLTGEPYWEEDSIAAGRVLPLMMKIIAGVKEPATARATRRTRTALPPGFDAWFAKATAVDAAGRFPTASALAEELGQLWGGTAADGPASSFATESTHVPSLAMESTHLPSITMESPGPTTEPVQSRRADIPVVQPPTVNVGAAAFAPTVMTSRPAIQKATLLPSTPVAPPKSSRTLIVVIGAMLLLASLGAAAVLLALRGRDSSKRPARVEAAESKGNGTPSTSASVASAPPPNTSLPPTTTASFPCPGALACEPLDVGDLKEVAPGQVFAAATKLVRSHAPDAEPHMLTVSAGFGPKGVDLRGAGNVMITYHTKDQAYFVSAFSGKLSLTKGGALFRPLPLPPLQCDGGRLWTAIEQAGVTPGETVRASIMVDSFSNASRWTITSTTRITVIDDATCAVVSSHPLR